MNSKHFDNCKVLLWYRLKPSLRCIFSSMALSMGHSASGMDLLLHRSFGMCLLCSGLGCGHSASWMDLLLYTHSHRSSGMCLLCSGPGCGHSAFRVSQFLGQGSTAWPAQAQQHCPGHLQPRCVATAVIKTFPGTAVRC